jgi:serine/threonine-protein phosphatase PP1 catalytic subunit
MGMANDLEHDLIGPAGQRFRAQPSLLRFSGTTLVVGDLHGDLRAAGSAVERFKKGGLEHLLLLGDYVDRGQQSVGVLELLLSEHLKDPDHVHMLRGNHETLWVNEQHGFKDELEVRGIEGLHRPFNEMFSLMPVAAVIDNVVFAVHGGVPEGLPTFDDIKALRKGIVEPNDSDDRLLLGLLWNDPKESLQDFAPNAYRGYMNVFGRRAFKAFMEKNGIGKIVRGHQRWPDGYRYFFDERLLSVFSCASYCPNVRTKAAIVDGPNIKIVDL